MHIKKLEKMTPLGTLKRFLLYGRIDVMLDYSIFSSEDYLVDIQKLLGEIVNMQELLEEIEEIHFLVSRMPTRLPFIAPIPFVLAIISKIGKYRSAALTTASKLFDTFQEIVLFVKFSEEIAPSIVDDLFRDTLKNWYEKQDVRNLAEMVARVEPVLHGYTHKSILTLANVFSSDDPERDTIYEFVHNGIASALEIYGDNLQAAGILEYLFDFCRLENLDLLDALAVITTHAFLPDQISSHHLERVSIWVRILDYVDIKVLNQWLEFLTKRQFFRNHAFISMVSNRLKNPDSISRSRIHPNSTLLTEKQHLKQILTTPQIVVAPSTDIASALEAQKLRAFGNIQRTGMDITVIIDCHVLDEKLCTNRQNVKGSEAAAMVAFSLKHVARNIKIYSLHGFNKLYLNRNDFSETIKLIELYSNRKSPTKAIKHCLKEDESSDLFVVVGYHIHHGEFLDVVDHHSASVRSPKFVFCNLGAFVPQNGSIEDHEDILVINGFNESTCDVITAFGACF